MKWRYIGLYTNRLLIITFLFLLPYQPAAIATPPQPIKLTPGLHVSREELKNICQSQIIGWLNKISVDNTKSLSDIEKADHYLDYAIIILGEWIENEGARELNAEFYSNTLQTDVIEPILKFYEFFFQKLNIVQKQAAQINPAGRKTERLIKNFHNYEFSIESAILCLLSVNPNPEQLIAFHKNCQSEAFTKLTTEQIIRDRENYLRMFNSNINCPVLPEAQQKIVIQKVRAALQALARHDEKKYLSLFHPESLAKAKHQYLMLTQKYQFIDPAIKSPQITVRGIHSIFIDNVPYISHSDEKMGNIPWFYDQWGIKLVGTDIYLYPHISLSEMLPSQKAAVYKMGTEWLNALAAKDIERLRQLYTHPVPSDKNLAKKIDFFSTRQITYENVKFDMTPTIIQIDGKEIQAYSLTIKNVQGIHEGKTVKESMAFMITFKFVSSKPRIITFE